MDLVGYSMSKRAADEAFAQAGFKPGEGRDQVGVIELHDCFAANEVRVAYSLLFRVVHPRSSLAHNIRSSWVLQERRST